MLNRRQFLAASSLAAANQLFGAPSASKAPNTALEKLGAVALDQGKKLKASYCDIRIVRLRSQNVSVRMTTERGTNRILSVPNISEETTFGFGVRVIVNGAWGFA